MNGTPMGSIPMNSAPMNSAPMNGTPVGSSAPRWQSEPFGTATQQAWPDVAHDELEAERVRLEAEVASARSRAASARHRATVSDTDMRNSLRAEIAASKESLTEMEGEYELTISNVRRAAEAEVDRILAEAHRLAAGLLSSAADSGPQGMHHAE